MQKERENLNVFLVGLLNRKINMYKRNNDKGVLKKWKTFWNSKKFGMVKSRQSRKCIYIRLQWLQFKFVVGFST